MGQQRPFVYFCADKSAKEFLVEKLRVFLATLAIVLTFGLAFTSCGGDGGGGGETPLGSVSYEYTKADTSYSLTVNESAAKAAYAPAAGDTYLLLIITSGETKTSRGTVASATGGVLTLKPENSGTTFTVQVNGASITSIKGTVTLTGSDGSVQGPDTASNNNDNNDNNGDSNNNNSGGISGQKTIIITGLSGKTGTAGLEVYNETAYAAIGQGTVSGGSLTIALYEYMRNYEGKYAGDPWTGSGSYYLQLWFEADNTGWVYTNGKTWDELGITFPFTEQDREDGSLLAKIPKYNISSTTSTIPFSQFCYFGEGGSGDSGGSVGEEYPGL
jgi:hypothetical protein